MESLEEDVLVQMVQDFIESESTSVTTSTPSNSHSLHHPTQYFILQVSTLQYKFKDNLFVCSIKINCLGLIKIVCFQDILRSEDRTTATEAKVMKYVMKLMRHRQGYEKTTSLVRWLVTRIRNHGLNASLCQTSWATSLGCPAGELSLRLQV